MNEDLIDKLESTGRLVEGKAAIEDLLSKDSSNAEAWFALFLICIRLREKKSALKAINKYLEIDKNAPIAWMNKGNLLFELKNFDEALDCFTCSLNLNSKTSIVYSNQANCLLALNRYEDAIESCDVAISLDPQNRDGWMNKANALLKINRIDEAELHARRSLEISPHTFEPWVNLGRILNAKNQDSEALICYEQSLKFNSSFAQAWVNIGYTHSRLANFALALDSYQKAADIDSDISAEIKWNMSLIYLTIGQYEIGWNLYDYRWHLDEFQSQNPKLNSTKLDDGSSISGKHIFIFAEQGLGDSIQFSRFLNDLVEISGKVTFQCHKTLINFIGALTQNVSLISWEQEVPLHDFHLPLLSLPRYLKIYSEKKISKEKYFASSFAHVCTEVQSIHDRRINVGIAWSGSSVHKNDGHRSIDFGIFSRLIEKWNSQISFHSLQKEYREEEKAQLERLKVNEHSSCLTDFCATAELIASMDLVICVDTSVAHVAGSIGKATWLLLANPADFRWLVDRSDTPWYSSVRLYRQPVPGDWDTVLQVIDADLSKKLEGKT
jgi:tetratricopeptide (TPR) repeat protein